MSEISAPPGKTRSTSRAAAEPGALRGRGLSGPAAFAAVAAVFVLFMAASSAPSPLYVIYQQEWNFSATTLTTVFAVYVVGMIGALLTLGALSDHVGRRPVLASAIALEVVAMSLFIAADNVTVLLIARFVQGVATGAAITTLGATLVDLNPAHAPHRAGVFTGSAPTLGLGLGALACGILAQYGPAPTRLIYVLLLIGLVLAGLLTLVLPETTQRRPGAMRSLQPRLGVAPRLRADLLALVPILVASWALGGLYLALGPSVAAGLFNLPSHVIGGLVVTLLCGPASITVFALRGLADRRTLDARRPRCCWPERRRASAASRRTRSCWRRSAPSSPGSASARSTLASFGTLANIAEPAERGELFAVAFVVSYLAFSIPAVVAGFAATHVGLHETSVVYSAVVMAFCALALLAQRARAGRASAGRRLRRARGRGPEPSLHCPEPVDSPPFRRSSPPVRSVLRHDLHRG
jgi:MFS family permease